MIVYLDTSVAVPLFVPEPASEKVTAWFESSTDTLLSADWILPEFASALSVKVKRGELAQKHAKAAWDEFDLFCQGGLRLVPVARETFSRAAQLIRNGRGGLKAGDALHLAMAIDVEAASIATADGQLEAGARAQGLAVSRF